MDCACVYVDVDECLEPICHETRKARKSHKCGECGRKIEIGENYEYIFGSCKGETEKHKTCSECVNIRDAFFCEGYYYGMVLELLGEHIHEMKGCICQEAMENLSPKAREIVIDMIGQEIDEEILQ